MKILFQFLLFLITLSFLFSCSSVMKSGLYVQIAEDDSLQSLADEYSTSPEAILAENQNKELVVGEWFFIPMGIGIASYIYDYPESLKGNENFTYTLASEYIWPVPASNRISSNFGRRTFRRHEGIDIPAPKESKILAVANGQVIYSGNQLSGYGNLTIINHGKEIYSVYAHANKNYTSKGAIVKKGDEIAEVGSTGRSSGPHLHFEMREGVKSVDPLKYIKRP